MSKNKMIPRDLKHRNQNVKLNCIRANLMKIVEGREPVRVSVSYSPYRLLSFNNIQEMKNMKMVDTFKIKAENTNLSMKAWRSLKRVCSRFLRRKRKLVVGLCRRLILVHIQAKRKVCRILPNTSANGCRQVLLNYDKNSYSKNFDDGSWQQEEMEYYMTRSFTHRYGKMTST